MIDKKNVHVELNHPFEEVAGMTGIGVQYQIRMQKLCFSAMNCKHMAHKMGLQRPIV